MSECSFKKEITLRKHKNTKHIEPVRADKELSAPKDTAIEAESTFDLTLKTTDTKKVEVNEKEKKSFPSNKEACAMIKKEEMDGIEDLFQ